MYTRGNSTWSVTTARRSAVIGGVVAVIFGTSGPVGMEAKYLSTSALMADLSNSPTMASVALFGV